jgi:hypothetical protein
MIKRLTPTDAIVYGYMPKVIFSNFESLTKFHRYHNHFEKQCIQPIHDKRNKLFFY